MTDKHSMRTLLRNARRALSAETQRAHAQAALQYFMASAVFQSAGHIAFYITQDGELDTHPFLQAAWLANKACYLPVLHAYRSLRFARYYPHTELIPNAFGILEPKELSLIETDKLDIVCMPVVGFDAALHRLGRGGGYYDVTFEKNRHPVRMGFAHECQRIDTVLTETHDLPLQYVLTENGLWG